MQGRRDMAATLQRQLAAEAAERRAVGSAAAVARENAAVAGQRTGVERLCALGFTPAQVSCGLAQGFASLEEVVDFLLAGGATDPAVQSVLADAAVRPAGTSPLRPAAAPGPQQQATQEAGDQSVSGDPGTAPPRAERIPGVTRGQDLSVEVESAAPDARRWRSNPAYKRGGWRVKRAAAQSELKRATVAGDDAAAAVARTLLRRDDHRAPARRGDARTADTGVAGLGRTGRRGQGGTGGRRSKARTFRKRAERSREGSARHAARRTSRQAAPSPTAAVRTIRRSHARR